MQRKLRILVDINGTTAEFTSEIFGNLEPITGAVEALKAMLDAGHDVFFCTAHIGEYTDCVRDKFAWVEKHFGKSWVRRIILTTDKTFISGDCLIDDNPKILGCQRPPTWTHILFTQDYNKDMSGPRITDWNDWESVISLI